MENKKQIKIVYKMKREDIMTFVSGLHEIQMEMIEKAVEKSGFKEANEVLQYIMEKK